jgi:hypothetical protein
MGIDSPDPQELLKQVATLPSRRKPIIACRY